MTSILHSITHCTKIDQDILPKMVLQSVMALGVEEFCISPSARNAALIYPLTHATNVRLYQWPEERCSAFFALGRIKATSRPVAVITTSGTAAAEVLPATMEAYYTGLPLILITADRPRRFRGTGAPQSAEQTNLFSVYVHCMLDLEEGENFNLKEWHGRGPLHINVCLEEPKDEICQQLRLDSDEIHRFNACPIGFKPDEHYLNFLRDVNYPLVIVGALADHEQDALISLLLHLGAPVYLEATSGIRENELLQPLRITQIHKIWMHASVSKYPIDGILRIGGVPTARLWRDLEHYNHIAVYSVSESPFAGLSGRYILHTCLNAFVLWAKTITNHRVYDYARWHTSDQNAYNKLQQLFEEEPLAEPSLINALSQQITHGSKIYLGNSSPIREWDLAASLKPQNYRMAANRGVNGIDGQLSTFLGYSSSLQDNWAILGDLTLIYDLAAPWITSQLLPINLKVVVINNGGAAIFKPMFAHSVFQNTHNLSFQPLAELWHWQYEKWERIPTTLLSNYGALLIELTPSMKATERFWKQYYYMIDTCL